jgi:hypothetical protein
VKGKTPGARPFVRGGARSLTADTPQETPGDPPAVKGAETGRSGQVGPEDTAAGREGRHPDPDEYADPDAQGMHSPHDADGR